MVSLIDRMRGQQMMYNLAMAKLEKEFLVRYEQLDEELKIKFKNENKMELIKKIIEEDSKYYTPNVEDIHIGGEYELLHNSVWEPFKIMRQYDLEYDWEYLIFNKQLRVQYLTKEQIEQNGWKNTGILRDGGTIVFIKLISKKEWYELKYCQNNKINTTTNIVISKINYDPGMYGSGDSKTTDIIYNGDCKSINDLRTIQSLLNIK